jgi:drug/metabolite transporter (DMT)-like permease
MSATQLKVMQEVISLTVFMLFAWWYFGEQPTWRTLLAFILITMAVALVRGEHGEMAAPPPVPPPPVNGPARS